VQKGDRLELFGCPDFRRTGLFERFLLPPFALFSVFSGQVPCSSLCDQALTAEPLVAVRGDERIIVQVRVGGADTINLLTLAGAEALARIEAPEALE